MGSEQSKYQITEYDLITLKGSDVEFIATHYKKILYTYDNYSVEHHIYAYFQLKHLNDINKKEWDYSISGNLNNKKSYFAINIDYKHVKHGIEVHGKLRDIELNERTKIKR